MLKQNSFRYIIKMHKSTSSDKRNSPVASSSTCINGENNKLEKVNLKTSSSSSTHVESFKICKLCKENIISKIDFVKKGKNNF